eukprot:g77041.t1
MILALLATTSFLVKETVAVPSALSPAFWIPSTSNACTVLRAAMCHRGRPRILRDQLELVISRRLVGVGLGLEILEALVELVGWTVLEHIKGVFEKRELVTAGLPLELLLKLRQLLGPCVDVQFREPVRSQEHGAVLVKGFVWPSRGGGTAPVARGGVHQQHVPWQLNVCSHRDRADFFSESSTSPALVAHAIAVFSPALASSLTLSMSCLRSAGTVPSLSRSASSATTLTPGRLSKA